MPLGVTIFLASFVSSLIALIGGIFAIFKEERVRSLTHFVVSFAIGALMSVAILDLIPEAAELASLEVALPYVLAGVFLFFFVEKFLFWYHCHEGKCPAHTYSYLILFGDFLHNFVDGVIIALSFLADAHLGILTTVAVILHEIPQEISDFGILMHGGFPRPKALVYNFLSATSIIIGAMITYSLGAFLEPFLPIGLALTAGAFIYLAAVDLMPELHEAAGLRHTLIQITFMALGVMLIILPGFFIE